ncbi:hypothetical protein E2C01_100047 [Portunus trituberculatus]|uniref:Uncharacterized protein n=1 Tax=Portunus trituberculatus TaxID=210409 RepID=A0A5B7KIE4_PORTR|nr:hypothetical protein [Portunus trituberculatus]
MCVCGVAVWAGVHSAGTSCKHTVWSGRTEAQLPAVRDRDHSRVASSLFVFLRVTLSARASPLSPLPQASLASQQWASVAPVGRRCYGKCGVQHGGCVACGSGAQGLGVRRTGKARHLSKGVVRAWPVPAVKDGRVW